MQTDERMLIVVTSIKRALYKPLSSLCLHLLSSVFLVILTDLLYLPTSLIHFRHYTDTHFDTLCFLSSVSNYITLVVTISITLSRHLVICQGLKGHVCKI